MFIRRHPKSRPITPGWGTIGPPTRPTRALSNQIVSESFKKTLNIEHNHRIEKLRRKVFAGTATETEIIIGLIECALKPRQPRFVDPKAVRHAA